MHSRNLLLCYGAALALVAVLCPSPALSGDRALERVRFEEVLVGGASAFPPPPPGDRVIRTQNDWRTLWEQVFAFRDPVPPCDVDLVDFRHEVVLASVRDPAGSGCSNVQVERVRRVARHRRGRVLLVDVRDSDPGRGCLCTQSFQTPIHAVVVPRPVGRVYFAHSAVDQVCSDFESDLGPGGGRFLPGRGSVVRNVLSGGTENGPSSSYPPRLMAS